MKKINDLDVKNHLQKYGKDLNPSVTFEQVWNRYSLEKNENKNIFSRSKLAYILSAAILLLIVVPVSAAVLPIEWNGIKITIHDDNGENARIDRFKEFLFGPSPTTKEVIENTINKSLNMKGTVSLKEAEKEFPFSILRPEETFTPTKSIGALMNSNLQENGGKENLIGYNYVFHDFYEKHNKWAIVTQSINQAATDYLTGNVDSMSSAFSSRWENVKLNDNTVAMFATGDKENTLLLNYKTKDLKIIELKVIGNQSKEELIKLAEAYMNNN
ncbi:hypothetical protein [Pseudoneobacillus sp. C159]